MNSNVSLLMDDKVPAGFTSTFTESNGIPLDLNELCIKHPASTFFARVDGYSMINAGIHDGDILVVDRSLPSANNSIIVAMYNGGFTVKRLIKAGGKLLLTPENPKFSPQEIKEGDDFEVWGVVTYVIKRV